MREEPRINKEIKATAVRVIGTNGRQIGILPLNQALDLAAAQGLDLVEVAKDANPPVCRLLDYGKYKYEYQRKAKQSRKNQKIVNIKEIKLRPNTEEHDYQFKLKHAKRFLKNKDKVMISVVFAGREITHPELGRRILERMLKELSDLGRGEAEPKIEGKTLVAIVAPK